MNLNLVLQIITILLIGKMIIRLGGRKSVSQMSVTQTVTMLGLGTILVHPITSSDVWTTLLIVLIAIIIMIILEYLQVKFDFLETFFAGKSIIVIENGKLNITNLKKIRLSVDALEKRLRQSGISSIKDVEYATIEVSGELGYKLKSEKEPMTKGDFDILMDDIKNIKEYLNIPSENNKKSTKSSKKIFTEIKDKTTEGDNEP
jgi:uncharacterized membrane protein YcaP (DUF421 family)